MAVRPNDPTRPKSRYDRTMETVVQSKPVSWFLVNVGNKIDPVLMRATGGRVRILVGAPTALLTHTGAKSGKRRTTPLAYFTQGEDVVLICSKAGAEKNPGWYHNLKANPEVELSTDNKPERYRAREATGQERERLFELANKFYSGFDTYQGRTGGRQIPVMVLSPVR